jgi:hypothetical protein
MADDQIEQELLRRSKESEDRIPASLATLAGQFLRSTGVGAWAVQTVAEIVVLLTSNGVQAKLPDPPEEVNEYVLATKEGVLYWVPSVAPAPAPTVLFGGDSVTFGGEAVTW